MAEAVARAAAADEARLRRAYAAGVAHGAAITRCTAEEERTYSPLRLLTLAALHLPDLALYAYLLDLMDEDDELDQVRAMLAREVGATAAGALRLAHRVLETHARDVGYATGCGLSGCSIMRARRCGARPTAARRCCSSMGGRRGRAHCRDRRHRG